MHFCGSCLCSGVSKDSDPAFLGAAEQLFECLGARSLPASDLLALDHMRTLLFLQDPGELQRALQVFTGHCTVPPGACTRDTAGVRHSTAGKGGLEGGPTEEVLSCADGSRKMCRKPVCQIPRLESYRPLRPNFH